jgi:hypothetical protein
MAEDGGIPSAMGVCVRANGSGGGEKCYSSRRASSSGNDQMGRYYIAVEPSMAGGYGEWQGGCAQRTARWHSVYDYRVDRTSLRGHRRLGIYSTRERNIR